MRRLRLIGPQEGISQRGEVLFTPGKLTALGHNKDYFASLRPFKFIKNFLKRVILLYIDDLSVRHR